MNFAPIPPELLAVPGLTLAHVRVWSHIWLQTLGRPQWTLSHRQIAEGTGTSVASVKRAVRLLQEHGWLSVEHRRDEAGDAAPSLILCTFPEGVGSGMTPPQVTADPRGGVTDDLHQKNHHQKNAARASSSSSDGMSATVTPIGSSKTAAARKDTTSMDNATWLAAELDANPTACQAAITGKQREAERRGRPWRNPQHMVRNVIPLDEWRTLVAEHQQQHATVALQDEDGHTRHVPARQRPTMNVCRVYDTPGHARHEWTDQQGRNRFLCIP